MSGCPIAAVYLPGLRQARRRLLVGTVDLDQWSRSSGPHAAADAFWHLPL